MFIWPILSAFPFQTCSVSHFPNCDLWSAPQLLSSRPKTAKTTPGKWNRPSNPTSFQMDQRLGGLPPPQVIFSCTLQCVCPSKQPLQSSPSLLACCWWSDAISCFYEMIAASTPCLLTFSLPVLYWCYIKLLGELKKNPVICHYLPKLTRLAKVLHISAFTDCTRFANTSWASMCCLL